MKIAIKQRSAKARVKAFLASFTFYFLPFTFLACTQDAYEKGEGDNSMLTAEFGMLHTNSKCEMVKIVTDANEEYALDNVAKVQGAKADTLYRALLYFNHPTHRSTTLVGMQQVYVALPVDIGEFKQTPTDPLGLESAWMSENKEWINLAIEVKTGKADDSNIDSQLIAVAKTVGDTEADGITLTILHAQNGVPEYYTKKEYFSIPTKNLAPTGTPIYIKVNTHRGEVVRRFVAP